MTEIKFKNQPPNTSTILLLVVIVSYVFTLYVACYVLPPGPTGGPQIITAGVPMFLVLTLLEMGLTWKSKFPHKAAQYSYLETWCNVASGLTEQSLRPVLKVC